MIRSHTFPALIDEEFPPLNPNPTGAASADDAAQDHPHRLHADRLVSPRIALRPSVAQNLRDTTIGDKLDRIHEHLYRLTAPWIIPPPDSEPFHQASGIVIPAQDGNFHPVVTIVCPQGRNGVLMLIANEFVGGGFQDFSGNIIWQILRNPGNGITTAERNFENIQASLGTPQNPARLAAAIRIYENDVIQLAAKNVNIAPAGQFLGGLLGGWFYPRAQDEGF